MSLPNLGFFFVGSSADCYKEKPNLCHLFFFQNELCPHALFSLAEAFKMLVLILAINPTRPRGPQGQISISRHIQGLVAWENIMLAADFINISMQGKVCQSLGVVFLVCYVIPQDLSKAPASPAMSQGHGS